MSYLQAIADSSKPDSVMESTTDAAEWKLEVERVLPLLKVHIRTDNKVIIFYEMSMQNVRTSSDPFNSSLKSFKAYTCTVVCSIQCKETFG